MPPLREDSLALPSNLSARCIAVLGQADEPTDAVEEYCRYLGEALASQNFTLEIVRVRWKELGRVASLREFRERVGNPQDAWFLLQYTALAWSNHAFPTRILSVIKSLKKQNARCAVIFHDAEPYAGNRSIDHLRRTVQLHVMRELLRLSDVSILTVPREKISWIPADAGNIVFIPVGANLPNPEAAWTQSRDSSDGKPEIAVFSITGDLRGNHEVAVIAQALRHAEKHLGPLRVTVFGRNSEPGGESLRAQLAGSHVEVTVLGLIPTEQIVRVLGSSHALLFVRGPISSRRGSAIAGIACGLPVIAQAGSETAPPVTDAGVVLVPANDAGGFGPALLRVLSDPDYRASLAERSRNAQTQYFSWPAIAAQYAKTLRER